MNKIKQLYDFLTKNIPFIVQHPELCHIAIEDGNIISTATSGFSYEYQYTAVIKLSQCFEETDTLIAPLVYWMWQRENEQLASDHLRYEAIAFSIDSLTAASQTITIKLKITDRVSVSKKDGKIVQTHLKDNIPIEHIYPWVKDYVDWMK